MTLRLSAEAQAAHDVYRPGGPHHARCHAPFTSMYFDQFGNVLACCINTVRPMGAYPAQRIEDIWTGVAAQRIRSALADDDFSLGCHDCHSSISSGNFGAVNATFDQLVAGTPEDWLREHPTVSVDQRDPWPRMLEFSLSTKCNLRCTMCSGYCSSAIRRAEGLDPLPEIYGDEFIAEIRPFLEHVTDVRFYGGEPFLAPVNFAVLEVLAEVNPDCHVAITTNGTIWNDRVQRALRSVDATVIVSIDAATSGTFEFIRQGASHSRVLENLERFSEVPGCAVSLAVCAMRQNYHEIPDLVRFANSRGMSLGFNVVRYPQDHSLSSASFEELTDVVERWESFVRGSVRTDADPVGQNMRNLESILAEARGWRAAAAPDASEVQIRSGSAAGARARRRDWLHLLGSLVDVAWDGDAVGDEASYHEELDRLLVVFDTVVLDRDKGAAVACALASHVDEPLDDEGRERFARLGQALSSSSVVHRVRLMAGVPPALIAQGVLHEDPDTLSLRLDSFFPPSATGPERVDRALPASGPPPG